MRPIAYGLMLAGIGVAALALVLGFAAGTGMPNLLLLIGGIATVVAGMIVKTIGDQCFPDKSDAKETRLEVVKNGILGGVALIWGAGILIFALLSESRQAQGAAGAGRIAAIVFALLLLAAGIYELAKIAARANRDHSAEPSKDVDAESRRPSAQR